MTVFLLDRAVAGFSAILSLPTFPEVAAITAHGFDWLVLEHFQMSTSFTLRLKI